MPSRALIPGLALTLLSLPGPTEAEPTSGNVVVTVGAFRDRRGAFGCRLFRGPQGFPERSEGTVERHVPITGDSMRCEFADLPPGAYAVSVMHDANDNDRLDKNALGIPKEGYGVSNNHTHALRSPSWKESMFVVTAGKTVELDIKLRY